MSIEFFCEHCQSKLRTPDETAGKRVRCPQCGNISSIPMQTVASPMESPLQSPEFGSNNPHIADGVNPYSTPAIDQQHPSHAPVFRTHVSRESIQSRLLAPGIALIVSNGIALIGGLLMLVVTILEFANGRGLTEEQIGQAGATFYVLVMSSVSVAGGIAMVSFKNRKLAVTASITSILNGLCCCIYPIAFGIWALVVLLDHDVRNHYN